MAVNNELKQAIAQQLDTIFAVYPATAAFMDLRAEISGDLEAATSDKIASGVPTDEAATQAIADFGDIAGLAAQLAADQGAVTRAKDTSTDVTIDNTQPGGATHTINVGADTDTITIDGKIIGVDITAAEAATLAKQDTNADTDLQLPASTPQNELHCNLSGMTELHIDYDYDELHLMPGSGNDLEVHEYFSNFNPEYAGQIMQNAGVVTVRHGVRPKPTPRITIGKFKLGFWTKIVIGVPETFTGKLQVTNRNGNVAALNLRDLAAADINVHEGSVQLAYLASKTLTVNTDDGNITLQGSQLGPVQLTSRDGNLLIEQSALSELTARSEDGNISANNLSITGTAKLNTRDGNAEATTVRAHALQVESKDGNLSATSLTADQLTLSTADGSIKADQLAGATTLRADDGSIHASWTALTGDITASSHDGSLHLDLPRTVSYNFDLHTDDGSLRQDETNVQFTKHSTHHRQGYKGQNPEFTITASTNDGNLTI
ncbi:DUF4097 family beta strand repeat-containing protein [Lacticaseibacillus zhaodongensis]|uniref:DUF4097 family beta strand repeat-containing protein n=1 Tax=Lacticaseibacillus zhaodongensis TaxID=2668065 RepID=UPI0012D36ADD|nr:DUF4097 family beta strand repeat-containing protein [Lacticaseibacillus zhaodongensis]